MDESKPLATGICVVCGKEFEYKQPRKPRKYCSDKCRNKYFNKKYGSKSRKARFERDPEYKKQYYQKNADRVKERTEERRQVALNELAEKLYYAETVDDIHALLEEYVRIKSVYYRG